MTEATPKPLIPLDGKPCLQHILESSIRKGCHHFVLCTGYQGSSIVDFVKQRSFDAEIEFSDAGLEASMLQRIYKARELLKGERSFIAYGDLLIDVNLDAMLEAHLTSGAKVTMTTAQVQSPFGLIQTDSEHWVLSFDEKPILPYYVGHMLMEIKVMETLSPAQLQLQDGKGIVSLFQELSAKKELQAFPYSGPQITFNTDRELHKAEQDFKTFFAHIGERGDQ